VEECSAVGDVLGMFHACGESYLKAYPEEWDVLPAMIPFEKPYEESRVLYENGFREQLLRVHTCSVPKVCHAIRESIEEIDRLLCLVDTSEVAAHIRSRGLLHNDVHTRNVLFFNHSAQALLDIDQMGIGPFVWDLGNTIASYTWDIAHRGMKEKLPEFIGSLLRAYHTIHPLSLEEYLLVVSASQRWDLQRILRSLRRHHYENDRLSDLLPKIIDRFLPRVQQLPTLLSFLNSEWLQREVFRR
jgi:Ser/Thr protein kinase RdoA (MazF antagonist)